MGAGASVEGLPEDKMNRFKDKLFVLDTLNENQKHRLLESMSYELKKLQPAKSEKVIFVALLTIISVTSSLMMSAPRCFQDQAAEKIQRISRGRAARQQNDAGPAGESTEEVFNNFCKTYRQTMMTNTIWVSRFGHHCSPKRTYR